MLYVTSVYITGLYVEFCLFVLGTISSMFNRSGKDRHSCLFSPELRGNVFSLSPWSVMRNRHFSKIPFMGEITSSFPIAERFSVLFLKCTVLHFVKQFCSFKITKCF